MVLLLVIYGLFRNPWISKYLFYRSSSQVNGVLGFKVFPCGDPSHNLETVSTPKPTTITLLWAMSIFSKSRLDVCERLGLCGSDIMFVIHIFPPTLATLGVHSPWVCQLVWHIWEWVFATQTTNNQNWFRLHVYLHFSAIFFSNTTISFSIDVIPHIVYNDSISYDTNTPQWPDKELHLP